MKFKVGDLIINKHKILYLVTETSSFGDNRWACSIESVLEDHLYKFRIGMYVASEYKLAKDSDIEDVLAITIRKMLIDNYAEGL
jgi:hypothetical protein